MKLRDLINGEHEKVIFKQKGKARMILAYHTEGNGVCFGGVRLLSHDAKTEEGLKDALRLSEAMTYKLALINEPYGGSKAVVFAPKEGKSEQFLNDVGKLIEEEGGKFITAIDFGFEADDAKAIGKTTRYILAIKDSEFGQSGVTTAHGVVRGIEASLKEFYDSSNIEGKSFAVQGLGSVGSELAHQLIERGGKVYVSDTDRAKAIEFQKLGAQFVSPDEILYLDVDVVSPCGPAYVINKETIPKLRCRIIAGGANCQLEDEVKDDDALLRRGIRIAPDYVINAGGVMQGIEELRGGTLANARKRLPLIVQNLGEIYGISRRFNRGTYSIAKEIANINILCKPGNYGR